MTYNAYSEYRDKPLQICSLELNIDGKSTMLSVEHFDQLKLGLQIAIRHSTGNFSSIETFLLKLHAVTRSIKSEISSLVRFSSDVCILCGIPLFVISHMTTCIQ